MRFTITGILFIWSAILCYGQKYYQYTISPDDDEDIIVEDAIRDDNGYIWMATEKGLFRYDGQQLITFRKNIPSQHGYKLYKSGSGFYYAHNAGISYIIPDKTNIEAGLIASASIDPIEEQIHYPFDILKIGNDSLWISQEKGYISLLHKGELYHHRLSIGKESYQLVVFKNHLYALSGEGNLFMYNVNSSEFILLDTFNGCDSFKSSRDGLIISGNKLYHLILDKEGSITERKIINIKNDEKVDAIALLNSEQLFFTLKDKGLFILNNIYADNPEIKKVFSNNDPHRVDELPFKNINRIVIDESGQSIFLCLNEGLGVLKKRFFESVNDLPNGNITSITGNDDEIYVNMGEVYKVIPTTNGYSATLIELSIPETVGSVHYFNDLLYCGTGEGKIYTYDTRLIELIDLTNRGEGIYFMHGDEKDRLWLCQAPSENPIIGIGCLLPNGQFIEYGKEKGLEDRILVLKESKRGRIYVAGIGEQSYLYRYVEEDDRFENMSLPFDFDVGNNFEVHDMTIGEDGAIYLASTAGLLRHDLDRINKIDLGDNYDNIEVRSVHATSGGKIWISTETQGVLNLDGENFVAVSEESGLPSKVMQYRCIYNDHNDRLWIGTSEGAVYTLTEGPTLASTRTPYLVASNFRSRDTCITGLDGEILELTMETISSSKDKIWYQYSIDDKTWSPPISGGSLSIQDLERGKHMLRVRSRINGGYQWSTPYSIQIVIKPKWFKNPLIYIPLLFFVVGSILFTWLSSRTKLNREGEDSNYDSRHIHSSLPEEEERMAVLGTIISKLNHGMKWDFVIEELSISLFRLHNVDAFIICWKEKGGMIVYEG